MHVLGIADGPDASAALCIDDRLAALEKQASFDAGTRARSFPWDAAVDVLRRAGAEKSDVRTIAIAGRITPPLAVRRHPILRRLTSSAFSGALDLGVFYQAMLRQTGLGALQADNAADWLAVKLGTRGFQGKLVLVDIHTALANAVYRFQDGDDVLICTLQPLGDGVSFAVHRGAFGQIDRVFDQKGFSSLHVHLHRCAEALECPDLRGIWTLAGGHSFDQVVVDELSHHLRSAGDRLSRAHYPFPTGRRDVYRTLRSVDRRTAAASVRENLRVAVCEVIAHHVRKHRVPDVLLAGEGFVDPTLVDAIRDLDGIHSVRALPDPGYGSLALGAAAYAAGLPMRDIPCSAVDPEVQGTPDVNAVIQALRVGRSVVRFSGRSVVDPFRDGDRCTWSLSTGPTLDPDERVVGGGGAFGCSPRAGSLLAQAQAELGPIRLRRCTFAGKPVHRLFQAQTLARSVDALVCAGPA